MSRHASREIIYRTDIFVIIRNFLVMRGLETPPLQGLQGAGSASRNAGRGAPDKREQRLNKENGQHERKGTDAAPQYYSDYDV